ncbi:MAG: glycosyltransferase [Patescibacteria group bacterium]
MNKISAVLVIYNEEKVIRRCLDSIKDLVDEIIIIHDGKCTDNSITICQEYTNKIFIREHYGIAEFHRILSFKKASNEWILQLDADEYINKTDHKKIISLIKNKDINSYAFLWRFWNGRKYITKYASHKICLVKKSKIKFIASPHEIITVKEGIVKYIDIPLEHRPEYNNFTFKIARTKWKKWAMIQGETLSKNFNDVEKIGFYKNQKEWPFPKEIRRKHPLLFIPIDIIYTFISMIIEFKKEINSKILKIILLHIYYVIILDIYIYEAKKLNKYENKN